jgi:hypothetical protein
MSNVIKLKRGQSANLASADLQSGELALTLDTWKLYAGDGTNMHLLNPTGGTAESAEKLTTARNIELTGDATGNVDFDGSADVEIATTLANTGVVADTYTKVTVDAKGRVTSGESLSATDIPSLTLSKISDAGTAAAANTGTAAGNVPVIDSNGKLSQSLIPSSAITDTFVVDSEAEMLALTANPGDVAVRTDLHDTFILVAEPASTLANWQELESPTSAVDSVNGMTGTVVINDITGNAGTATALQTGRTIGISGGATGTATSFDGTANITIPITALNASSINTGTIGVANGGTGVDTITGIVKGNGTSAFTAAVSGTDYLAPDATIDGGTF